MLRLLALSLVLFAPFATRAAPVEIALSGFGVTCGGGLDCPSTSALSLGGTLHADLGADLRLTSIFGMLGFTELGTGSTGAFEVTGGTIDLHADGDPGSIASIFEPYISTKEKGSGLGLAIVKHNTELYGGTVRVESTLGKGTKFILQFPARTVFRLRR